MSHHISSVTKKGSAPRGYLRFLSLLAGLVPLALVAARLYSQEATISVDVKVVNVPATVRDKHGQIVNTLTKEDFLLQEDGRQQSIRYFSRESDLPLTLGLLVDTSMSQRRVLDQERSASYSFLDKMLQAKDQAFVIHFDREVELLQDLTSSREKLEAALGKLQTPEQPQSVPGGGSGGGQGGGGNWPGGGGGWPGGDGGRGGHVVVVAAAAMAAGHCSTMRSILLPTK